MTRMTTDNYLIVGLGNPGDKYKNTRHNVGFIVLDALVGGDDWTKCTTCNSLYKQEDNLMYLKPQTMMNLSGGAVECRAKKHNTEYKNIIVIHDDIDILFGEWRISFASGDGGHNGIKSIIQALGTKDFVRIRIGIAPTSLFGKIKKPNSVERFVLGNFPRRKISEVQDLSKTIKSVIGKIISDGVGSAMNKYN